LGWVLRNPYEVIANILLALVKRRNVSHNSPFLGFDLF